MFIRMNTVDPSPVHSLSSFATQVHAHISPLSSLLSLLRSPHPNLFQYLSFTQSTSFPIYNFRTLKFDLCVCILFTGSQNYHPEKTKEEMRCGLK